MLYDALHPSLHSIEENTLFEYSNKNVTDLKKNLFNGWIPNNSGLLRWERIALGNIKGRLSFNYASCVNEGNHHQTIEILDTNIEIRDDIPGMLGTFKDYFKATKHDLKASLSYFIRNGFSVRAEPIFYSSITFKNINDDTAVKIGEGHKVKYGGYDGVASLCFYSKKRYKKISKSKLATELRNHNQDVSRNKTEGCAKLDNYKAQGEQILQKNQPFYSYEVKYKVESQGRITMQPLKVLLNPQAPGIDLQPLVTEEGYKHVVQLLYGLIKKVYHGDNHHHRKDDVILQVHETNASPLIILDQMASHIKGLEKIESNRESIPCNQFVPSYWHDAKGIQGYAKMYYKHYVEQTESKTNGEKLLCAIDVLVTSIETSKKRFKELQDAEKEHKFSLEIFKNPSIWILFISFSTLMYTLSNVKGANGAESVFANTYISSIVCMSNQLNFFSIFTIFLVVLLFSMGRWINKVICKKVKLHTDYRPKDKEAVNYFGKQTRVILSFSIVAMLSFAILMPSVKANILSSTTSATENIYYGFYSAGECFSSKMNKEEEAQISSKLPQAKEQKIINIFSLFIK